MSTLAHVHQNGMRHTHDMTSDTHDHAGDPSGPWGAVVASCEMDHETAQEAHPSTQAQKPADGPTGASEGLLGASERYKEARAGTSQGQVLRSVLDNVLAQYRDMSPQSAEDLARQFPFHKGTITEGELECIAAAALSVLVSLQRRCRTR
jgi:hypothetical protein